VAIPDRESLVDRSHRPQVASPVPRTWDVEPTFIGVNLVSVQVKSLNA
jgi:hypothetical protein